MAEEPEINLPTSVGLLEKQESFRKTSTSVLLTMPKPLTLDHKKLWKIHKRDGNMRPPYLPPEKFLCMVKKQQLELDLEQQTGSKLEKEYVKAVCCHPAYLTYMQSTS